ncbi:MAG: hypothetical protein LUQ12_03635 [Methanoregulaceae archaeon]|jgi:hypothetical protein|nr:hypothetical protein [Methanoregulaceae archaeon]
MGGRKTLTIGVTVNLEHYENLRLEVSGDVESPEDAENLSRFLDTILGSFGRDDPATAERVNSYRRRVLPGSGGNVAGGHLCTDGAEPLPAHDIPGQGGEEVFVEPKIPQESAAATGTSSSPKALPVMPCTSCGAPVSPAEQKMSQLFTSRILCRVCMKNL